MSDQVRQAQAWLREIGFKVAGRQIEVDGRLGPQTKRATTCFQFGWTPTKLATDGIPGPLTLTALEQSAAWGQRPSEHFRFLEFASRGNGEIWIDRELVLKLEQLREVTGPVFIASGYRDPSYNRSIGGAKASQHLYGRAVDPKFTRHVGLDEVRALGLFSGIGHRPAVGNRVEHVDIRPSATPAAPTVWTYPR